MAINDELLDMGVRRGVFLERFENHEVREVRSFLERRVLPDVHAQVMLRMAREAEVRRPPSETTRRLRVLHRRLREITGPAFRELYGDLRDGLIDLSRVEAEWQRSVVNDGFARIDLAMTTTLPDTQTLRQVVTNSPFRGRTLREWSMSLEAGLLDDIRDQVAIGIANGEPMAVIERRLRGVARARGRDGVYGKARRSAEAVTRSAVIHASNAARDAYYGQNSDIIKGVQWVATLDAATCPSCGALDGQVWAPGEGPRPPDHMRCRCTTVPVIRSFSELGLGDQEVPESTRSALDGQVSEKLRFGQWLRRMERSERASGIPVGERTAREVLGVKGASMWRRGEVNVRAFRGSNGRTLTLDELRQVAS